jgi:hypothetical protein
MIKATSDLILIAGTGVNLVVDASTKSTSDLITIIGVIGRKGGHITIKNCGSKSTTELLTMCNVHPTNVTLDFSDK